MKPRLEHLVEACLQVFYSDLGKRKITFVGIWLTYSLCWQYCQHSCNCVNLQIFLYNFIHWRYRKMKAFPWLLAQNILISSLWKIVILILIFWQVGLFFSVEKTQNLGEVGKVTIIVGLGFVNFVGLYILDSKLDYFLFFKIFYLINSVSLLFTQINHSLSSYIIWFDFALFLRTHLPLDPEAFLWETLSPIYRIVLLLMYKIGMNV